MQHLLIAIHVLLAIFAIGPLIQLASTAARGIRAEDPAALRSSAKSVKIYGYLSVLVAIVGMSLVQPRYHHQFGDTWVWMSAVLWLVATATVFSLLLPALDNAATALESEASAQPLVGRVAASGGIIAGIYAVIVILMVYKPGS